MLKRLFVSLYILKHPAFNNILLSSKTIKFLLPDMRPGYIIYIPDWVCNHNGFGIIQPARICLICQKSVRMVDM